MALLKRVSSLRRSNHSFVVSRRGPEPDNAERPKGMLRCHTTLLDGTVFTCDIDKHCFADTLLDVVFTHLDILERDYFGLAYQEEEITKWLDPSKLLKKQFKGTNTIYVNFKVKFYVTDPVKLHEELTRYQFYLQIKKDLYTTRLPCSFESAALLASYMMQAELGDYDHRKHPEGYVSQFQIIPKQSVDFEERVMQLHQTLTGKTTDEIEYLFLAYARRLEFYGVELFQAKDHHGVELGLGITCNGVSVFKGRTLITTFAWLHIIKITYKRKRFYIELRPELGEQLNVVGFHMTSYEGCKQLWKNCIEYHAFFRRTDTQTQDTSTPKSKSLRRKARGNSYVGRTEQQASEANRIAAIERSKSVKVVRRPSKIFQRSSKSRSPALDVDFPNNSPYHGGLRRTHSLKSSPRPTMIHVNNGFRERSRERDLEIEPCSSEVSISDDMTGQFSLVPVGQDLPVKFRRFSNDIIQQENAPTEYYDERNAMEERIGQVSMDDLASEGLLLIRILPNDQGRYGFIVKGGADESMPVIVTKITPDSPASSCNPPVEEGDQVLYINGKSISEKSHEQIIFMITSSITELVMIVKPRNLKRVNPTLQSSLPRMDDPGHILRESLTTLKGSFTSGKGLLHFDRLYRRKPGMAAIASKLPQNLGKNRYRDISAYDETRVHLKEGSDYINANFVNTEVYATGQINQYIASQGPMQHTCKDHWQMIWEQGCTAIVMLTDVIEAGKVRCCRYWPEVDCTQEYGKYEVTNLSEQRERICLTRQLRLKNRMSGEDRRVVQMQYIDWPDHGIPGSKVDFLRFVQGVRSLRSGMATPLVVHCSAGIGRTGVFMLMETALCKMEVLEPIYPLEIVRNMRDQRGMLVQTPIQYQFVCESILKAYEDDYVEIELPERSPSAPATVKSAVSLH